MHRGTVGRGSKRVAIGKPRAEAPGEINCFGILDFQPLELRSHKFLLFKLPGLQYIVRVVY